MMTFQDNEEDCIVQNSMHKMTWYVSAIMVGWTGGLCWRGETVYRPEGKRLMGRYSYTEPEGGRLRGVKLKGSAHYVENSCHCSNEPSGSSTSS